MRIFPSCQGLIVHLLSCTLAIPKKDILWYKMPLGMDVLLCVCLHVCLCPISNVHPGLLPGGIHLRFVLDQQISVKYFSVELLPPAVKLRGKSEPEKPQKQRKNSNYFSCCVWHQCSCHFFLSFSFVISFFPSLPQVL